MSDEQNEATFRAVIAAVEEARHHLMDARSSKDEEARDHSLEVVEDLLSQVQDDALEVVGDKDVGMSLTAELVSEANHAIRGPLGAAIGHLDLLRSEGALDEAQVQRSIQAAWEGSSVADRYIQEFFDIANAWAKRPSMPLRPVSMDALVQEVTDVAEPHAKSRQVRLRYTMQKEVERARVDPDGFQEMLEMMIQHAVDAADEGSVVDVAVRAVDGTVRVEVEQPGSCKWTEERHFEPFGPAEAEAPIGLSALRHMARMRAGSAGVKRHDGAEVIWFTVPDWQQVSEEVPAKAPPRRSIRKPLRKTAGPGPRVLIVEDDRSDLESLRSMLDESGYEVQTAGSVDAAVEAVEKDAFDAVTLDLLMGRSYSMRVLAAIHDGRNQDAAVLVLSATRPGNVAFPFPVQAHLQKPVKKRLLLRALRWSGVPAPNGSLVLLLDREAPPGLKEAVDRRGGRLVLAADASALRRGLDDDPSVVIIRPRSEMPRDIVDDLEGVMVILWGEPKDLPAAVRGSAFVSLPANADVSEVAKELEWILEEAHVASVDGGLLE